MNQETLKVKQENVLSFVLLKLGVKKESKKNLPNGKGNVFPKNSKYSRYANS